MRSGLGVKQACCNPKRILISSANVHETVIERQKPDGRRPCATSLVKPWRRSNGFAVTGTSKPASTPHALMSSPLRGDKLHVASVLARRHALLTSEEAREVSRRIEAQV